MALGALGIEVSFHEVLASKLAELNNDGLAPQMIVGVFPKFNDAGGEGTGGVALLRRQGLENLTIFRGKLTLAVLVIAPLALASLLLLEDAAKGSRKLDAIPLFLDL